MTDNFLGEIRLFSCSYAPTGWALCNGAILQIKPNAALYSLIGKYYGGDGVNTFALPDLRGRVPICMGRIAGSLNIYNVGDAGGTETVPLTSMQMPSHNHDFLVYNGQGTSNEPNDVLAIPYVATNSSVQINIYNSSTTATTTLNAASIVDAGAGAGHNNMQPFLSVNFCIALQGLYPTRS